MNDGRLLKQDNKNKGFVVAAISGTTMKIVDHNIMGFDKAMDRVKELRSKDLTKLYCVYPVGFTLASN